MSIFRIYKNKNFTVMSNKHLKDKKLSYRAKGLLSFMLSLPDNWDYSINGLVKVSKEGTKAIKTILKELQEVGYLEIIRKRGPKGQYEYEQQIFEISRFERIKARDQKGEVDKGEVENGIQINTKEINTKKKKNKQKEISKNDKDDYIVLFENFYDN